MSDRATLVLQIAALPPLDAARADLQTRLLADVHATPRAIAAKFRDFTNRKLITSTDPGVAQLTAAGRRALDRLAPS